MNQAIKVFFTIQVIAVLVGIFNWGDDAIFAMDWLMFVLSGILALVVVILGTASHIMRRALSKLSKIAFGVSSMGLAAFSLFSLLRSAGIINHYAIVWP